jgi:hypothetical protein
MTEAAAHIVKTYLEGKKLRTEQDDILLAEMLLLIKDKSIKTAKKGLNSFVIRKYWGGQNPLPGETYHQHAKCTDIFRRYNLLNDVSHSHGFTVEVATSLSPADDKFCLSGVETHYEFDAETELKEVYLVIRFLNYDASTMVDEPCSICMQDYVCGELLSKCRQCTKYFHKSCWMKVASHQCPLCRAHCQIGNVKF